MSPRAVNIAQARADGTFDAKRNTFNAANSGSYMDAQGNIGPKAPPLPGAMPTTPTPAPTPAAPAPANVAKDSAPLPKPKAPATFDGQSKAGFFGAAMARNGRGSSPIYDDPAVQSAAANSSKALPKPSFVQAANPTAYRARNGEWMQGKTQTPVAATPAPPDTTATTSSAAAAADTRGTEQAEAIQGAAKSIAEIDKIIAANKATRKPMPTDPAPVAAKPTPASQPSGANFGAARNSSFVAAATNKPSFRPQIADKPKLQSEPRLDAAQAQAVKNPSGLSARMNPPGAKPRGIAEDALVGKWWQGEMQKAEDLKKLGSKIASGFKQQASKNPQGLAAKITRLFGGDTTPKKKPAGVVAAASMN